MPTLVFNTVARKQDAAGIRRRIIGVYTGPASYATGGDPCTPTNVGLSRIEVFLWEHAFDSTPTNYSIAYDYTNEKLIWFDCSSGNEVVATTDLSAIDVRFEAAGLS